MRQRCREGKRDYGLAYLRKVTNVRTGFPGLVQNCGFGHILARERTGNLSTRGTRGGFDVAVKAGNRRTTPPLAGHGRPWRRGGLAWNGSLFACSANWLLAGT